MGDRLTEALADTSEHQKRLDSFYHAHGPCCAGCDWWHSHNSRVGSCRRSAIVPGADRADMLGVWNVTMPVPAGHPLTKREHICGEFKDEFDWSTLPLPYRKRVGAPESAALHLPAGQGENRDG